MGFGRCQKKREAENADKPLEQSRQRAAERPKSVEPKGKGRGKGNPVTPSPNQESTPGGASWVRKLFDDGSSTNTGKVVEGHNKGKGLSKGKGKQKETTQRGGKSNPKPSVASVALPSHAYGKAAIVSTPDAKEAFTNRVDDMLRRRWELAGLGTTTRELAWRSDAGS